MEYKDLTPATLSEEQLRSLIQQKIASNENDLPSERLLEAEIGVSRTTLRRSLSVLEKEGLIKKSERKGITINSKIMIDMLAMNSMSDQLKKGAKEQMITVLKQTETVEQDQAIKQFLQLQSGEKVFKLTRKRSVNQAPSLYEISYLKAEHFPDIAKIDFTNQSLYKLLKEKYHVYPTYGREEIRFVPANQEQAEILEVPLNTPLFEVVSKAFDQNDQPIEYSKQYLISNQVAYKIKAQNIFDYREDEDE